MIALATVRVAEPEMFGEGCAERSAADDDEIERPQLVA